MRVRIAFVLALVVGAPGYAFATPFTATYTFTGSLGNQVSEPVDSNPVGAMFADITRGSGLTPIAGANSINSEAWTTGAVVDPNDYYQFAVAPQGGFALDVTQIAFSERRSGQGVITIDLRSSLDLYASSLFLQVLPDDTLTRRFTVALPSTFQDLTSAVTFRFFGYAAQDGRGTWRLGTAGSPDNPQGVPANLQVSGDITAIPEPATLVLLSLGLGVNVVRRRLRA